MTQRRQDKMRQQKREKQTARGWTHLLLPVMVSVEEVSAQVDADCEILLPGVDLGLQTLVVFHQQFHTRHISVKQTYVPMMIDILHHIVTLHKASRSKIKGIVKENGPNPIQIFKRLRWHKKAWNFFPKYLNRSIRMLSRSQNSLNLNIRPKNVKAAIVHQSESSHMMACSW